MLPVHDLYKEQEHVKHPGALSQFVCQCWWNKYRAGNGSILISLNSPLERPNVNVQVE